MLKINRKSMYFAGKIQNEFNIFSRMYNSIQVSIKTAWNICYLQSNNADFTSDKFETTVKHLKRNKESGKDNISLK